MKTTVYNLQAQATSEMELADDIFAVVIKPEVVHQVFVSQMANQRQALAHTKDRSEVSGGGKKPWAQKGTGRARHGSNRSPIWSGGGVTFGPLKVNSYKNKINKKTRRLALRMCLTDRVAQGEFAVIENFDFEQPKTGLFTRFLQALPIKKKTYLVLTDGKQEQILQMTKNLDNVETRRAEDLNIMDVLNNQAIIASQDAVKKIQEVLKK
ncbi:MAG: 50S ribosomal protein L4 [bacterium]